MEIELISIIIKDDDLQENFTGMFPITQPYFLAQKFQKTRRPRKKRETVAHLIDALIENIDSGSSD